MPLAPDPPPKSSFAPKSSVAVGLLWNQLAIRLRESDGIASGSATASRIAMTAMRCPELLPKRRRPVRRDRAT